MENNFTVEELFVGTNIVTKIMIEESGLDESVIDAALSDAYVEGISAEAWEQETRIRLGLNPYWHEREEEIPAKRNAGK